MWCLYSEIRSDLQLPRYASLHGTSASMACEAGARRDQFAAADSRLLLPPAQNTRVAGNYGLVLVGRPMFFEVPGLAPNGCAYVQGMDQQSLHTVVYAHVAHVYM